MTLKRTLVAREREAKALKDWYAGKTDRHPQGRSGLEQVIPSVLSCDCWDRAPRAWRSSEWGRAAAFPGTSA